jgi:hypothetical protein
MLDDVIYIPNDRFVYYDESGEITSISNTNDDKGNYIILPLEKVMNFLTGKERTSSYAVVYDTLIKQYVLKLKYYADENAYHITNDIYRVELGSIEKSDLTIVQDIKNKKWIFEIDQGLKNYLKSITHSRKIHFSITRKNDPHDLYRLIIVDFSELIKSNLEVPFKYQTEENTNDISVYTTKRFETYTYEVKHD